ncbi:Di-copper centre-containing protein [Lophium mytilinum]|uniref:tyrosinase n=1 Tax=Lophium mytilinum TaxID=390894 RepID=A0A6A6RBG0_9PEZI|nr:Di-copper centre-containing protein [Lophium mytilinum]
MPIAIKGIQTGRGPNGELPIRREIDEWWFSSDPNDLNQRSLFIYALIKFQNRGLDKNDDRSYLNIAGIHGYPLLPWPRNPKESGGYYCAHDRVTFATWHTPYMLLFEQRLHEEMLALIPSTFAKKDQDDMIKAADTWRLPFWDWAMKKPDWNPTNPDDPVNKIPGSGPNVPFIITQKQIPVRTKTEIAVPIDNPMFQFAVPGSFGNYGVKDETAPWYEACRVTSRWPDLPAKLNVKKWNTEVSLAQKSAYFEGQNQDYKKITKQLQGSVGNEHGKYYANTLPEAVYRLFRSVDAQGKPVMPYEKFSTGSFKYGQRVVEYPSLEAIHNNIHNFSGGSGYLGDPSTAAYDPLFWLHHCNVDRLLAIWQDLFSPETHKWLDTGAGGRNGPEAKLSPFSTDEEGNLFTSVTCSFKHQEFGYTYPELKKWVFTKDGKFDQEAYSNSIHTEIERLYSTTPKAALLLQSNKKAARQQMAAMTAENLLVENFPPALIDMVPKPVSDSIQAPLGDISSDAFGDPAPASWQSNDYVVNVVYERFALEGRPYSITFFLGDVPSTSAYDFADDLTAIGRVYNFSSEVEGRGVDESGCASCKELRDENALSSGQVILTDYLIERITLGEAQRGLTLGSLDQVEVIEYLRKNLHWRITDFYENIIPKENMPSLKISVATAQGTHFSEASKPSQYSAYTMLWDTTEGRLGGAAPGDV